MVKVISSSKHNKHLYFMHIKYFLYILEGWSTNLQFVIYLEKDDRIWDMFALYNPLKYIINTYLIHLTEESISHL